MYNYEDLFLTYRLIFSDCLLVAPEETQLSLMMVNVVFVAEENWDIWQVFYADWSTPYGRFPVIIPSQPLLFMLGA